jgi:hypothetical protein
MEKHWLLACTASIVCLLVLLLISQCASAAEGDDYHALLSWAAQLSGNKLPAVAPVVVFVPQAFFDQRTCGGHPCRVWGWYPNEGANLVYVHERARALIADGSSPQSTLAASIVVHEFVHYLQAVARNFAPYACEDAIALEREAYDVQRQFIAMYGEYQPIGASMHAAACL